MIEAIGTLLVLSLGSALVIGLVLIILARWLVR